MMTVFPLMGERRKTKITALLAEWRTPNRSLSDIHRAKTACPRGHPYDEANTAIMHGSRYCRACWKLPRKKKEKTDATRG